MTLHGRSREGWTKISGILLRATGAREKVKKIDEQIRQKLLSSRAVACLLEDGDKKPKVN